MVVATSLAGILTGGNTDITVAMEEDDILAMEKEAIATSREGIWIHWIGCNTCLRPASH